MFDSVTSSLSNQLKAFDEVRQSILEMSSQQNPGEKNKITELIE